MSTRMHAPQPILQKPPLALGKSSRAWTSLSPPVNGGRCIGVVALLARRSDAGEGHQALQGAPEAEAVEHRVEVGGVDAVLRMRVPVVLVVDLARTEEARPL